jgi:hypothetical protein
MSQPIKTKAGEILVLKVPVTHHGQGIIPSRSGGLALFIELGFPHNPISYPLPQGDWQLLGTISYDRKYSFDPEPFVKVNVWADMVSAGHDYTGGNGMCYLKPDDALISLIESQNQILWSNPMGIKPSREFYKTDEEFETDLGDWQDKQDLVIKESEIAVVLLNHNK